MKITAIRAHWLSVPIPEAQQHTSDFGRTRSFDATLVEVETDAGITGYGEAKAAVGSAGTNAGLVTIVEKELAPLLIGQDPRQISRLWDVMYNGSRAHYAIARGHVFPVLGRRGHVVSAISGVDMALWDILGKSLNAPVHQLLGGKRHETMPAYASGGWKPTAEVGAELKSYIDRGNFRAVKMRVGSGDGTLAHSIERVHAARDYLGPDIALMCDAHGTFTVAEAKRFCRAVAECNIDWLEEPVTADNTSPLTINGVDLAMSAFSLDLANQLSRINLPGPQVEVAIGDRQPSGSCTVLCPALGVFDPFALAKAGTNVAMQVTHGSAAGKQAVIDAKAVLTNVSYTEVERLAAYTITFEPTPVSGNDEFALTIQ